MSLPRGKLLSVEEVADYFPGQTVPALRTQRWRNRPPGNLGFVVGKKLVFRAEDIEEWINRQLAARRAAS